MSRAPESHLQSVLDTLIDGVLVIDAAGIIGSVNHAAERVFGYPAEELIGQNVRVLMPPPYSAEHDDYIRRYLTSGEAKVIGKTRELVGRRKDGTEFPMLLGVGEFGQDEQRGFTGIVRDLTQHRQAEKELRRRSAEVERLQRLEAVGRFSSGLAHEYRNLLMGIQGFASMALEQIDPSSTPPSGIRSCVEEILAAARRGTSLATRLLAFARPADEDALAVVNLDGSVAEAVSLLRGLLEDEITITISQRAPGIWVQIGEGAIQQIVLNLALNAKDAMPKGGQLAISTQPVPPTESGPSRVSLTVTDTGSGMDSATLERIFEPFFTTKSARTGTGLGLSTVHSLVSRAGGRVTVDSTILEGTRFRLTFPVSPKETPTEADEHSDDVQPKPRPTRKATVLVVEDERLVLLTVNHYLQRAGHRALLARNPSEALELCETHPEDIDLILTDVSLPVMGGWELARRIKAQRPTTAVLFMSAHSRQHLVSKKQLGPTAATIEKPFDERQLSERIAAVLDRPHSEAKRSIGEA